MIYQESVLENVSRLFPKYCTVIVARVETKRIPHALTNDAIAKVWYPVASRVYGIIGLGSARSATASFTKEWWRE